MIRDKVVLILAIGLVIAIDVITIAVAFFRPDISDNGTRLLTMLLGGVIGIVGAYLGFKLGKNGGSSG